MEMKIEISQGEAFRLACALEYMIETTKERTEKDIALINNLRAVGGIAFNTDDRLSGVVTGCNYCGDNVPVEHVAKDSSGDSKCQDCIDAGITERINMEELKNK